jgi:hypothetical protein
MYYGNWMLKTVHFFCKCKLFRDLLRRAIKLAPTAKKLTIKYGLLAWLVATAIAMFPAHGAPAEIVASYVAALLFIFLIVFRLVIYSPKTHAIKQDQRRFLRLLSPIERREFRADLKERRQEKRRLEKYSQKARPWLKANSFEEAWENMTEDGAQLRR